MMAGALGRTYFDANIFIYAIEISGPYAGEVGKILDRLEDEGHVPVTSEYTLAECLVGVRKANRSSLEQDYLDYFSDPASAECHPLTKNLLVAAARMAGDTGMRLADSIHVATAVEADCTTFVTNDRRLKLPSSLRRISVAPTPPAGS